MERDARVRRRAWLPFVAVALLALLDLWSKAAVFEWLPSVLERGSCHSYCERLPVLGDWLALRLSENKGAAFGRFGDYPHILVFGRALAVICLSWLLWRSDFGGRRLLLIAMVLVLAGAIGNLGDNLGLGVVDEGHPYGKVRDFIDVWFHVPAWSWDWHFPTFNVADSCISVGAVLWIGSGFFHGDVEEEPAGSTPETAETPGEPVVDTPAGARPAAASTEEA